MKLLVLHIFTLCPLQRYLSITPVPTDTVYNKATKSKEKKIPPKKAHQKQTPHQNPIQISEIS